MAEIDVEDFAIRLTDETDSHEQWLAVARFGLGTLLANQRLLAEIIVREASREAIKLPHHVPADHIAAILAELGLRLVPNDEEQR